MSNPPKITLLYLKHTGHVLAALTRNAAPGQPLPARELAAEGALVRRLKTAPADVSFLVPASELDSLVVNGDDAILTAPREYRAVPGDEAAAFVPANVPQNGPLDLDLIVDADHATFTLKVANGVQVVAPADLPVSAQVYDENVPVSLPRDKPAIAKGFVKEGQFKVVLNLSRTLPASPNYQVIKLVAGVRPSVQGLQIP